MDRPETVEESDDISWNTNPDNVEIRPDRSDTSAIELEPERIFSIALDNDDISYNADDIVDV